MVLSDILRRFGLHAAYCTLAIVTACGTNGATGKDSGVAPTPGDPGRSITATEAVPLELTQALAIAENTTGDSLVERYPVPRTEPLSYDPTTASGMELINASSLALSDSELAVLKSNGLVISASQRFPSFAYGYKSIYADDLPVYVSADSILEAVHRTFDSLLVQTEEQVLLPNLAALLDGMHGNLTDALGDARLNADVDLYLSVAVALLKDQPPMPKDRDNQALATQFFELAKAGEGHQMVTLFGVPRDEDFSQFEPRGHYTDSPTLERYFKTMMWLGRVDLRLIETQGDGSQVFYRRQFDAAVALRSLMTESEVSLWGQIDAVIGTYVGEHDSMTPADVAGLMSALGVTTLEQSRQLSDEEIVDEIESGGWGSQRIASRIIIKDATAGGTLPLDRSFLLFGQRYTVDSHTFVNVTFDRVRDRLMPTPLDVAFAALGNNAALPILESEFSNTSYVAGLAKTRTLVDAHEPSYWEGSLYTHWLGALRSLSDADGAEQSGLPRTPAWQRRMLSTQLASWAQLRHDTILYAKQSYTAGIACEFPDAYVDPYPEFYARLGALARRVTELAATLPERASELKQKTQAWAMNFEEVSSKLEEMATNQLAGAPHSKELLDFINDAVKWDEQLICGGIIYSNHTGWYLKLYLNEYSGIEYDPTIADVHTQPTDLAGNDVGRILHVGTGMPRLMVVTAETCQGPRAYAGLAFAYGELITENWQRLNDQQWLPLAEERFPDAPWMSSVLAE
jgi:hypothetical protein